MLIHQVYQHYGTTIVTTVCGLTSLATIGYIFVDSHHCFMKRQKYLDENRLKELKIKKQILTRQIE